MEGQPIDQAYAVIEFEYPLNERIRSLLRLEDIFARVLHFHAGNAPADHHGALLCLFELLDVASRADLKVDLVQELERQRQTLLSYRDNPDISEAALNGALAEIEQSTAGLLAVSGRVGHYLRENDWLMGIRSRAAIPGGACQFDLPSYHYWQCGDADARRRDMDVWLRPLLPIRDGVAIVMRLLRGSGRGSPQRADGGSFQLTMSGQRMQLVRVCLPYEAHAVPEISANKYMLNVRFIEPDPAGRPRKCEQDVDFELTLCTL